MDLGTPATRFTISRVGIGGNRCSGGVRQTVNREEVVLERVCNFNLQRENACLRQLVVDRNSVAVMSVNDECAFGRKMNQVS